MNGLSEITKSYLERAGWSNTRTIDTTIYERAIVDAGLPLHPIVVAFLREFGELRVEFPVLVSADPKWNTNRGGKDWFVIDPIKAIEGISPEWVEYYNECAGERLCPIGQARHDHATLLMAEDGSVYGSYDEEFWEEGKTGIEALENICVYSDYRDRK
jgi:hypothetical protein